MARSYANVWSRAAARLTAAAHTRASLVRWGVLIVLAAIWAFAGWMSFRGLGATEAVYRTFGALSMYDDYFGVEGNQMLELARFAALALPLVGLLFAFSGALGRNLAQAFNLGAAHHVVIAGDSPAALSLAHDCRSKKDAVILIGQGLPEDTALGLRRLGVIVLEGDATRFDTLRAARAHHAAHVVAFETDDTANLQIEAAVRRLVGEARRKPPIGVHVATRSPMLLREAREMRSAQARKRDAKKQGAPSIDPKPFSLEEMAARQLLQREAQTMLDVAAQMNAERVHIIFFGFDAAASAVAERVLMTLWSVKFGPVKLTVLTPQPEAAEAHFKVRHPQAFAHAALWEADIAFLPFDWDSASVNNALIARVEAARGKPTVAIVATGSDPGNIHLSIALKRACNDDYCWPIPIFMKESSQSEFSQQYAKGDDTEEIDAYLQAFGSHQVMATRAKIIDGQLDRGAAIAHEHYNKHLSERDPLSMRELQAAMRDWADVLETYRAANRAVSDAAMVKLWDAGWRPARDSEKGDTNPTIADELIEPMARREHDRWVAERLIAGWRFGETRNNDQMVHDKLVTWDGLNEDDRARDVVQVRAAFDIARMLHPKGFVRRV